MECYYRSNADVLGYRERQFSDLELDKIKEKPVGMTKESDKISCEGSVGFGVEDNAVCEIECHVVLEDTSLNRDRYSNNDECEVVSRQALKHGTVLQEDGNEKFEQLIWFVYKKGKEQLKPLRGIPKAKVKCAVNKVNCSLKKIDI